MRACPRKSPSNPGARPTPTAAFSSKGSPGDPSAPSCQIARSHRPTSCHRPQAPSQRLRGPSTANPLPASGRTLGERVIRLSILTTSLNDKRHSKTFEGRFVHGTNLGPAPDSQALPRIDRHRGRRTERAAPLAAHRSGEGCAAPADVKTGGFETAAGLGFQSTAAFITAIAPGRGIFGWDRGYYKVRHDFFRYDDADRCHSSDRLRCGRDRHRRLRARPSHLEPRPRGVPEL